MWWWAALCVLAACGRIGFDPAATTRDTGAGGDASLRTYAEEVIFDHPVVYWRLDETQGTTASDATGDGNTGTYTGQVALAIAGALTQAGNGGVPDHAVSFSQGSFLDGGNRFQFSGVSPFTFEAWFRAAPIAVFQAIGGRMDRSGNGVILGGYAILIWPSSQPMGVDINRSDGASSKDAKAPASASNWVYVVAAYDGVQEMIYTNGTLVQANTMNLTIPTTTSNFHVGDDGSMMQLLTGDVDEVAVYSYSLSADRVLAHYRAGTQ